MTKTIENWEEFTAEAIRAQKKKRRRYRVRPGSIADRIIDIASAIKNNIGQAFTVGEALTIVVMFIGVFVWVYLFQIVGLVMGI